MSKCCCRQSYVPSYTPMYTQPTCGGGTYNFSTLIILILIILQWSKGFGRKDCDGEGGYGGLFEGNGILFIIAIFFLVCGCGCGKGYGAGYTSCGCGY